MHIVHEASVADAFNYDDGMLVGTLDFINEPGHLDQLERRMTEIVGKTDAHAHLDAVIPTRGTTAVVGKGFSEESIPTIELQPNEWPRLSESGQKHISVPVSQVSKISNILPTLIRLKSNNKPEVIMKVISLHAKRSAHWDYSIEWTPEGYMR